MGLELGLYKSLKQVPFLAGPQAAALQAPADQPEDQAAVRAAASLQAAARGSTDSRASHDPAPEGTPS